MICVKCRADNPDTKSFCGECGAKLEPMPAASIVPGDEGAYYCYRHKKEVTRLRCGRCETPICTKCAVFGPVGPRCRECARNRVPLRPRGVLHSVGQTLENGASGRNGAVWYMVIWGFILSFFSSLFGGHRDL